MRACLLMILLCAPRPNGGAPPEKEAAAVSTKMLAESLGYQIERDDALDAIRLRNRHDELVFVPGMRRFSANGLVLDLSFAPYYQGDRLYVPVDVINYISTPMPEPDTLPLSIRSRVVAPPVGLQCVFIDPGHGGKDPGAIGPTGLQEKYIALDVALKLKEILEGSGVRVVVSRTGDYFIPLEERARRANSSGAQIFVSIHANAAENRGAVGIETFYLGYAGPHSSPGRRADTLPASKCLASCVQQSLATALATPDRGIKEKDLNVLRNSTIPAVLVEVGFLSNPRSERLLYRPSYRQRLAALIHRGIAAYSERR